VLYIFAPLDIIFHMHSACQGFLGSVAAKLYMVIQEMAANPRDTLYTSPLAVVRDPRYAL
jgi:hypothetical protein